MNYINFTDNYNQEFSEYITQITKSPYDTQERIIEFDNLIEAFIAHTGERPKSSFLNRITNSILKEVLANKETNKRTNTEYPVLSINQIKRRLKQEPLLEDGEIVKYYGNDGKFYLESNDKANRKWIELSPEEQKSVSEFFRLNAKSNGMNVK